MLHLGHSLKDLFCFMFHHVHSKALMALMLLIVGSGIQVRAIEIIAKPELPAQVLSNINAHVSVFNAAEDCIISNRYRSRIREAIDIAIKAGGFYQANIIELEPVAKVDCQRWQLHAELGAPLIVENVQIRLLEGEPELPLFRQFVAAFPLKPGDKFEHRTYEQWKSDVISTTLLRGHFDFKFVRHEVLLDNSLRQARIVLHLSIGPRYRFGQLQNLLDEADRELIVALRPFEPGEPYDSQKLNLFTQQLKRSGYFSSVFVRPLVNQAVEQQVPLEVVYQFKPMHQFNVGGGVSSDTGPRVRFSWQRSRLNSAGHSIETELSASLVEQSLAANYRIPLRLPARNFISLQMGLKHTDDNDTQSDTLTLAAKRHWLQESGWQRIAQLRFEQETFTQADADETTTRLLMPGIALSRFRSEGELDPYWGDKQLVTLEGASKALISDIDLIRTVAQSRWLRTFGAHRWFFRAEVGALNSSDFAQVPSSLRFFAGGDQSVRGFGYETLSPVDAQGQLTGGRYLYTSSLEYSFDILPQWRLALFADAGNAGDKLFQDVATGLGAGVHWVTPVGPLRVYVARGNSELESTWRLHFSLGSPL